MGGFFCVKICFHILFFVTCCTSIRKTACILDCDCLLLASSAKASMLTTVSSPVLQVMILSADKERGRMTLTTKKLEKTPGDMLRDPQLVFDGAEEMAKLFKERLEGIAMGASTRSMDSLLGSMDGYDNPANAIPSQGNANSSDPSSYAF